MHGLEDVLRAGELLHGCVPYLIHEVLGAPLLSASEATSSLPAGKLMLPMYCCTSPMCIEFRSTVSPSVMVAGQSAKTLVPGYP